MAIRTSVKKAKAPKTTKTRKGKGKSSVAAKAVKKAKARKPAMSIEERRKRTREAVRKLRARQRAKGLTYNHKVHAWVAYKDKKTAARARSRAGKKSPFFGKPVKNLAARLTKRARTQAARKPGFNSNGKRRARKLRIGKRPVPKMRKKSNVKRMDKRTKAGKAEAHKTMAQKNKAFWANFGKK